MKSLTALIALTPLALAQQLCDQYGYTSADAGLYFNNNMWGRDFGSGSQCLTVDWTGGWDGAAWHTDWTWSGGDGNVKSYPHSGRNLHEKKLISNIGSITTSVDWAYSGNNIRANVAYDLFTAADPNHSTSSGDYELMIWLGRLGEIWPIGPSTGFVTVGGRTWELFDGYNGNMRVFSFVAPQPVYQLDTDVKQFFNHLSANKGFPASSQHLLVLQFGTEPFTGGPATLSVKYWNGVVN